MLLSPPGRWSDDSDVAGWASTGRPVTALVPELDEFASPDDVARRFAGVPQAEIIGVPGAKHLWVGETYARIALDGIVRTVEPGAAPLPTTWHGPDGALERRAPVRAHGPRGLTGAPRAGAPTGHGRGTHVQTCTYFAYERNPRPVLRPRYPAVTRCSSIGAGANPGSRNSR